MKTPIVQSAKGTIAMNTKEIKIRIEGFKTKIQQAQARKARADTRQQEANDQRDIDGLRAQLKELES